MITDPRFAPKRTDLPWLRHRTRPKSAADGSAAVADFLSGHADRPRHHAPAAPSLSPPATPVRSAPSTSVSTSLDLDAPAEPAAASGAVAQPPAAPARVKRRADPRVRPGDRVILRPTAPTVTLTRMQSGIGSLTVEAACSPEVGDLRLGVAYELADRTTSTAQSTQGERFAPAHSKRPILVCGRGQFETITLDLRQVRSLRRLAVYAFSESRSPLTWGGTLVVTTYGGARVEVPLDTMQGGTVAVLMTVYVVDGECILRAEMQSMYGDVREASRAYGYDRITWLDDRTPVT